MFRDWESSHSTEVPPFPVAPRVANRTAENVHADVIGQSLSVFARMTHENDPLSREMARMKTSIPDDSASRMFFYGACACYDTLSSSSQDHGGTLPQLQDESVRGYVTGLEQEAGGRHVVELTVERFRALKREERNLGRALENLSDRLATLGPPDAFRGGAGFVYGAFRC